MKTTTTTLLLFLAVMMGIMVSCSKDDNAGYEGKNYTMLSAVGDNQIRESANEPLEIKLLSSYTAKENTTITLALKDNDEGAVRLKEEKVTIKAGEKTAMVYIESTHKYVYTKPQHITLTVVSSSDKRMELASDLMITVVPSPVTASLTEEQRKLIEGYKKDYNIDLYRLLGELKCKVDLVFPIADLELFPGEEKRSFETTTTITLSEKSTPTKPVLKMIQNPLGLTGFAYERLRKVTDQGEQWSDPSTHGYQVVKAIGFDASKETFAMELDNIRIDPVTKKIEFLDIVTNMYDEKVLNIPFIFHYSAWERQKKMAQDNVMVKVPNGDQPWTEENMNDLIRMGISFRPENCFYYSPLDRDSYKNEPTDWFEASAKLDLEANQMIFHFPWDHDTCSGHTNVRVVYTLK
ncbi:MAG: DUF4929 family protein [Prevotella bivia]|jgi:hypothetical protein|uniref:DUF4929 family protein n=1 Tax=Prevotella bivia TaxID=28125 RepID=UPI002550ED47|nr:DUF4929 family protein [Prevotella bivia]MDU2113573.1 DUF4929 family protein [Prevotella bivia]MDU7315252.1 DUF4929 family protein [Prevotella bivia]MDZ3817465.1 DUF4929 family protein [Prevotella bivia]WIL18057.1 DUF4929 family protein [Prevotella bivia]